MSRGLANPVFAGQGTTIFTVMSALAAEHGAINLGQGFPDEDGPLAIREAAARALREGPNQYPPMTGVPALRQAIARHIQTFRGLTMDPDTEIVVTSGATEALTASFMALTSPGDETIIFEPAYDSYRPALEAVGAVVKTVRLEPPHFRITEDALAKAFSERTRLIAINSPMNPTGRVLTCEELEIIAGFVRRFDAWAVCDEVYEHLVFDDRTHIPLMSLPGMRERCVRIGSAGKMFSLTGWKIGWVTGPAALVSVIAKAHQFLTFTTSPALQIGIAHGLDFEMGFTLGLQSALQKKRDFLSAVLSKAGLTVLPSEGTYFLTVDASGRAHDGDRAFCERLTVDAGIAAIPYSPFYGDGAPHGLIRFAFCKRMEVLEAAAAKLTTHFAVAPVR